MMKSVKYIEWEIQGFGMGYFIAGMVKEKTRVGYMI